jgi:hypothetical protein
MNYIHYLILFVDNNNNEEYEKEIDNFLDKNTISK